MAEIHFLKVSDNPQKLTKICQVVQHYFNLHKALLILVPNQEVAEYIDQLLWKIPEESFLPHSIVNSSSTEKVIITSMAQNFNEASIILNLTAEIHPFSEYEITIELFDETHPAKREISQQKVEKYRQQGLTIKPQSIVRGQP